MLSSKLMDLSIQYSSAVVGNTSTEGQFRSHLNSQYGGTREIHHIYNKLSTPTHISHAATYMSTLTTGENQMVHALNSTDTQLSGHNKSCHSEDTNHTILPTDAGKHLPALKVMRLIFDARKCARMDPEFVASLIKTIWRSMHGLFYPATLLLYKVANLV